MWRRGALVNLEGTGKGNDHLSVQNYIDVFCTPGTQKRGSCVRIAHIRDFTLQVLMSTIMRIVGSSSLHLATWNQMRLAVDCMHGALYEWCSRVVPIMKRQLSDCKRKRWKNSGYSSILVSLFFKRVPGLSPTIPLPVRSPCQPRLSRWGDIFLHQGGGDTVQSVYDDDFYFWWEWHLSALEQFPYVGMDFWGDLDLVLPLGGAWGELGK